MHRKVKQTSLYFSLLILLFQELSFLIFTRNIAFTVYSFPSTLNTPCYINYIFFNLWYKVVTPLIYQWIRN